MEREVAWYGTRGLPMEVTAPARRVDDVIDSTDAATFARLHYAKSYRPFELFVNENYKL